MIALKYNQSESSIDIHFPYNETLVQLVKLLPDREFKTIDGRKFWRVPIQPNVNLATLLGEFIEDCKQVDIETHADEDKIFQAISIVEMWEAHNLALSAAEDYTESETWNSIFKGILTGIQRAAAEYMFRNARGVINGNLDNDRKLSTLAVLEAGGFYPALIICPQNQKYIWGSRAKLLTGKNVLLLGEERAVVARLAGDLDNDEAAPVIVVNYGILPQNEAWLSSLPWRSLVLDMAHHIRSSTSEQAKIIQEIARDVPHRFLLSDTDYMSDPVNLAVQLEIAGRMKPVFGSRTQYLTRYRGLKETSTGWHLGTVDHIEELDERLRSNCYVKSEVENVQSRQEALPL